VAVPPGVDGSHTGRFTFLRPAGTRRRPHVFSHIDYRKMRHSLHNAILTEYEAMPVEQQVATLRYGIGFAFTGG
jgi:hypothetical protein